jgi:hypothetical protein
VLDHVAAAPFGLCARVIPRDTRNSFIPGNFLTNRESHCPGVFWKLLGYIAASMTVFGALSRMLRLGEEITGNLPPATGRKGL